MPTPNLNIGTGNSPEELNNNLAKLVKEVQWLLSNLDSLNIRELTADKITTGTLLASLVKIISDKGSKNVVWIDETGFHVADANGVERVALSSSTDMGIQALVFKDETGAELSGITYGTEAPGTGFYLIGPNGSYIMMDSLGRLHCRDSSGNGFDSVGLGGIQPVGTWDFTNATVQGLTVSIDATTGLGGDGHDHPINITANVG